MIRKGGMRKHSFQIGLFCLYLLWGFASEATLGAAGEPGPVSDPVGRAAAALAEDGSQPERWRSLVFSLMSRDDPGDRREAVEVAREAEERFPTSSEVVSIHARALVFLGEFDDASATARRAISLKESNAEAHIALGEVHLAEWRLDAAQTELERAAALSFTQPDPFFLLASLYARRKLYPLAADNLEIYYRIMKGDKMPFRRPGASGEGKIGVWRAMGGRTPFVVEGDAVATTVSMHRAKSGLYLVKVKPNGGKGEWFDIDSGSESVLISHSLMRKLGLETISTTSVTGIGGKVVRSRTAILDSLTLGDFTIRNIPVEVMESFPKHKGKSVSGRIGQSFLREFIVTMNFPARTFTLELPRRQLQDQAEGKGRRRPSLKHTIPMRYPSITMGTWEEAETVPFLWDTGAGLSVLDARLFGSNLSLPAMQKKTRRGKDGTGEIIAYRKMAAPSRVRIDDLTFSIQPTVLDLRLINRRTPYLGGILGADAMQDYLVTFDYFRGEIRLQKVNLPSRKRNGPRGSLEN